jgi:hypothetical protein
MSLDEIIKDLEPAHTVPSKGTGSRELFDKITASPPEAPRKAAWWASSMTWLLGMRLRLRLRVAAPLLASWLAPGVGGLGPEPAAALDITRKGDDYIITVKDAFADPKRYQEQIRDLGLDIALKVQPVSPGLEGVIFEPYDPRMNGLTTAEVSRRKDLIRAIERPGACADSFRCTIGVRIPVNYRPYRGADHSGSAVISLGRKARPGERYVAFGQLNNLGEPLECTVFVNKTVSEVQSMLRARGVTVGTFAIPMRGRRSSVPDSWYVHEGFLTEPGKALLVADENRVRKPAYPQSKECRGG